ncbi:MAG TPA: sialidase family protein [Bacteroidia bacterium]|nr:sialidase family protein [Bacteroidia bacterium]
MKKLFFLYFICVFSINTSSAQFLNVLIDSIADPNEVSIAIDFQNPNYLVAGANLDNVYSSKDTGRTWVNTKLTSEYTVYGDPCIINDYKGNFYYFHLSDYKNGTWIDRIVAQKSYSKGQNWELDTYMGLNNKKAQDKEWAVVDQKNGNIYVTWTQFDKYESKLKEDKSLILFSKSLNEGKTWSEPAVLSKFAGDCLDDDNTVEGAVPCVGLNGEINVAWAGPKGLVFNQSKNQGEQWFVEEKVVCEIPGGWNYDIDSVFRCNGLPITACDLSNGPNRGTIYINWSDQRNGKNNTDVWMVKSQDNGISWSKPIKVNNDKGQTQQFMSWFTIDQSNGRLYCLFYDRRNHNDVQTDVYLAYSDNGGESFTNIKINEKPFLPSKSFFFGDYINILAHNDIVRPIWMSMNNNKTAVWTALIDGKKLIRK